MSILLDDSTIASNPGKVDISIKKFAKYYRIKRLNFLLLLIYSILPKRILAFICNHSKIAFWWVHTKEKFLYGCVNPAIIIDRKKSLVAVYTNLAAYGIKPYPVIKIYKEQLNLLPSNKLKDRKLATVAIYEADPNNSKPEAWKNFHPQVPDCFSKNETQCKKALKSIESDEWKILEEGIIEINKTEEGLYFLNQNQ